MQPAFTARRGIRAFVAVLASSLALSVGVSTPGAGAATTVKRVSIAQQAARWMSEQILANGGYLTSFGSPDPTNTAYAVIGLRAAHVGQTASDSAIAYLETQLGSALQSGGSDSPGALAYDILAAVASNVDPTHFGGATPSNDLVARLLATQRTSGADAGLFGAQDPTFDGAFRQGLALAALKAAKVKARSAGVVAGVAWLTSQQCADGLWQPYRADTSAPCDVADPNFFTGPDTNSSAMAMQGLAAWGKRPLEAVAVSSLRAVQSSDGGWPYIAAAGQASDPDSTALVIQGLLAEQQHPQRPEWATATGSPLAALASYQLGCTDSPADRGAFFFPGDRTPNVFATVQAVPAMLLRKLPIARVLTMRPVPAPVHCP